MTERRLKRPRDAAQLAKLIVDIATGEIEDVEMPKSAKSPTARVASATCCATIAFASQSASSPIWLVKM